jgi:hypothetical protein
MLPEVFPWLALLGLFLLKPNRSARAWWIWLPLLVVFAVELGLSVVLNGLLPSEVLDIFCQVARALAFGIAAVWLASPFLGGNSRFLTSLKMLLVQASFSLFTYICRQDWEGASGEIVAGLIYLGIFVLGLVAALSLAGRTCRRHFHPLGLSLCLFGWLIVCFVVMSFPFAIFAFVEAGGQVWVALGIAILISVGVQFALVLSFLILSFKNSFYRERLRQLLKLETPSVPPVLTSTPTPAPAI